MRPMQRASRWRRTLATGARGLGAALACWTVSAPGGAEAFCRTTTSHVPADYDPSFSGCWTEGLPLYWANACVGYDLQQGASKQLSYAVAAAGVASAFSKWTSTICSASGAPSGRVSIDVRDLGPVACDLVQYNQGGPNQHLIAFRDDAWPYNDSSNTLALTTVTYDTQTGEIYDADMEINSHDQALSVAATVPPDGYDFESIVTHETGHFLGMAHSTDVRATMYAHYTQGDDVMRNLTIDDVTGLCSIYAPDGVRHVALEASPTGTLPAVACDPTPRHGWSGQCGVAAASSCSSWGAPGGRRREPGDTTALVVVGVLGGAAARRRRTAPRTPLPKGAAIL